MDVFTVHIDNVSIDRVPAEVVDFISPPVWRDIVYRFRKSQDDALCYSCAVEWCCCCLCGFFPIFCCHPCINNWVHGNTSGDQAQVVNYTHFQRARVVHFTSEGFIQIDMRLLQPPMQISAPTSIVMQQPPLAAATPVVSPMPAYAEPVMVSATVVTAEPTKIQPVAASAPTTAPTSPASSAPGPRMVRIVLPSGGQPGQQIVVNAPDGQQVAVTLSTAVAPGQAIDVQY